MRYALSYTQWNIFFIFFIIVMICVHVDKWNRSPERKNMKTGRDEQRKQYYDRATIARKTREKMRIDSQFPLKERCVATNPKYAEEIRAFEERWKEVGSEAEKKIVELERRWDAGERW